MSLRLLIVQFGQLECVVDLYLKLFNARIGRPVMLQGSVLTLHMNHVGWIRPVMKQALRLFGLANVSISVSYVSIGKCYFASVLAIKSNGELSEERFLLVTARASISRNRRHMDDPIVPDDR